VSLSFCFFSHHFFSFLSLFDYTFESFVAGVNSQFAHAAATAVAGEIIDPAKL
jgi:chromosomal replication initiation ATPase DnaA